MRFASLSRGTILAMLLAPPVLAQGSAPVLGIEAEDSGAEVLAAALADEAGTMLGAGGEFASCLAKVADLSKATHEVVLRTQTVDGVVTWTLELRTLPGEEVLTSATGSSSAAEMVAQGALAAREALAPLCAVAGGDRSTAYEASGGGAQIEVTGTVEDLDKVFFLYGTFPGGTAEFAYTPVSPGGGAVEYTLSGSGVTGSGEGLYSLAPQPDGTVILEQTTDGCVDGIPGSCRTNSETITLTPVQR